MQEITCTTLASEPSCLQDFCKPKAVHAEKVLTVSRAICILDKPLQVGQTPSCIAPPLSSILFPRHTDAYACMHSARLVFCVGPGALHFSFSRTGKHPQQFPGQSEVWCMATEAPCIEVNVGCPMNIHTFSQDLGPPSSPPMNSDSLSH